MQLIRFVGIVGALQVLIISLWFSSASALEFSIETTSDGKSVLLLEGRIVEGDGEKARSWLNRGGFREIWLHSPGGATREGYAIGREIRARRLATRVPKDGRCMSACVDVLIGGVVRFVDSGAIVMVHPGSVTGVENFEQIIEGAVENGQSRESVQIFEQMATAETADWIRYLTEMGVSLDLAGYAAKVPHKCGISLKQSELIYFNIANTLGTPAEGYKPSEPDIHCP